ncbi:hypothetical protein ALO39_102014 [Pseudomonas syringae pv. lapsa]|nr:hypothetical protein ALO39_102014 [Pseudomonas syringae pv. lapsa]
MPGLWQGGEVRGIYRKLSVDQLVEHAGKIPATDAGYGPANLRK